MKATMDSWPRKDAVGATLVVAPFVASGQRGDHKGRLQRGTWEDTACAAPPTL